MSTIFDGPNKAPKVDAYKLAHALAADNATPEPADLSAFSIPNPEFQAALDWASKTLDKAGVSENEVDPSLGEIMRAAFQQENTVGSLMARSIPDDDTPDLSPEEIYTRVTNEGMVSFLDEFRGVQTEGEYEARKANIQREIENRQMLDAAGWTGTVVTLGAAVVDPINLVPVGGAAARVGKLAKTATRGRKAALETALAGGVGAGLAEGALHATQETRTGTESVMAVAAGTVLGGALGFAVDRAFGREIAERAYDRYDAVRSGQARTGVGAQVVRDLDEAIEARFANDERLSSAGVVGALEAFEKIPVIGTHLASPARVLSRSASGAARLAMKQLVSDPTISKANAAGVRSLDNVEAAFGQIKGQLGDAQRELSNIFAKHRDAYGKNREVFNSRVAHALAHGDKSPDGDAVAEQAAAILRKRVYEPIKQALVENNVFTKEEAELLNAESYFPVVYSPDSIRGDEAAFIEFHEASFRRVISDDARNALIERDTRRSNIEDEQIAHRGVRQLVPKVDENGNPVINPKTGRQVMSEKIVAKGKVRELKEIAKETFEAEAKELRTERDTVLKAFNKGDDWPYAGPGDLDNPFAPQFEKRNKLRTRQTDLNRDLESSIHAVREARDEEIKIIRAEADRLLPDKRLTVGQAKGKGAAREKDIAKAKSDAEKTIKELRAKAAPKLKEIDKDLDALAKEIDGHYETRIAEARNSRDEAVTAATDAGVAAILKARGVDLTEGYTSILSKYTRDGQISDELVAKEAAKRANKLYRSIVDSADPIVDHEVSAGLRGYAKARKNPADHVQLMQKGWAMSDAMAITDRYAKTAGMDSVIGKFFKREVDKLDASGAKVIGPDGKAEKILAGDMNLTAIKKKIRDEYDGMVSQAVPRSVVDNINKKYRNDPARLETELKAAKTQYEKRLEAKRDADIEALDTLLNFARGRSSKPGPEWLRDTAEKVGIFNYVRLMGGIVVSSLGDPLNLVISQGLGRSLRHGIVPMLTDFKAALRSADGEARRLARLSGANLEMEFNATMAEIGGFTNPWVSKDKLQVWRTAAEKFSTFNGVKHWNSLWKQAAYNTTQARLIDDAVKGWSKLSKSERAWLANLGVDEGRLASFADQFNAQTRKTVAGGMPLARWDEWADKAAGEAFRAATYKESFNVVITPGLYDRLNAHSNPVGRLILQFRNHMFANTARLTARNIQLSSLGMDKAANAMTGLVGLLMMGALIDAIKTTLGDATINEGEGAASGSGTVGAAVGAAAGLAVSRSAVGAAVGAGLGGSLGMVTGDTVSGESVLDQIIREWQEAPVQSLYNANDRAGWLGPVFEASNILHSTAGGGLQDILRFLSDEDPIGYSRVGGRSMLDVAGGASAGALSDIITSTRRGVSAALNEDVDLTLSDVKRMERLGLPMNLPYLRPFINEFNQYVGTMYDWPTGH